MMLSETDIHLLEFNPRHMQIKLAQPPPPPLPHKALGGWKGGGQKSSPQSLGVPFLRFCLKA